MMSKKLHQILKDVKGIGPKRYQKILNQLEKTGKPIDSIFTMLALELKQEFGLPINVAQLITQVDLLSGDKSAVKPQSTIKKPNPILTSEIITVTQEDEQYPKHLTNILGDKAPEKLYMWGNLELLEKPSVGFCGSRNVSEKGIEVTIDTAQQIAELGWIVVSGHAKGVDTAAHRTALENNAGTIIVISEGIDRFRLRKELKNIAKPENLLIISEFPRNAGWTSWRAMQRNQTIIALSDAMIILESRLKGGTFNAGKTAMKLNQPLYVATYQEKDQQSAGNEYFIQRGVQKLMKNKDTKRANLSHLREAVEKYHQGSSSIRQTSIKPHQLSLLQPDI